MKKILDSEKRSGLRHAGAYFPVFNTEVFRTEGKFMIYFIGDKLFFGALHNKADLRRALSLGDIRKIFSFVFDRPRKGSVRGK